jgi:hypothetical protein
MKYIKTFEKYQPIITGDANDPAIQGKFGHKIHISDITPEMKDILDKSKFKIGDQVKLLTDAAVFLVGGLDVGADENGDSVYVSDFDKYKKEKDKLTFEIVEAKIYTRGKKTQLSFMLKKLNMNSYIGWIPEKDLELVQDYEIDANKYNL